MWWNQRLTAFDLETTSADPDTARIVTAAIAFCGGGAPTTTMTWLANPGVPIPEEATGIHGISTARARAEGLPIVEVLRDVLSALALSPSPIVVFNARYDLTVLDREARRHGLEPLELDPLRVIDPLVIDKWLDRYRPGSRKLAAMCEHYGATLEQAHHAAADAIAAARLAWCIGKHGQVVRRMGREREVLIPIWERVRCDLDELQAAQVAWADEQAVGLADHFRRAGRKEEAASVRTEWPFVPFREGPWALHGAQGGQEPLMAA